jgi:hypothetical protein
MMTQTLRQITNALENLTIQDISIERALDLLEASTQDLEEIIAINMMRETMQETRSTRNSARQRQVRTPGFDIPMPINVPLYLLEEMSYYEYA